MRFTDPMPARIKRVHYKPSWRGDRLFAIKKLGRSARVQAIDINFQWVWFNPNNHAAGGQARAMHWTTPRANNYLFFLAPGAKRARRMTRAELKRPVTQWRDADVAQWRRTTNPNSGRVPTYLECVMLAKRVGVIVTAELKSPYFAYEVAAKYLVASARKANHPAWFMALYSMKNVRGKAKAIHLAGGQFAVIFGRFRKLARVAPKDWSTWKKYVTRLWGPARWGLL